jgi:hypothetical protein
LILSTHLCLGLHSGLFPSGFPIIFYMHSSSPPRSVSPILHLRTETDPVSETLCFLVLFFLECLTMEKAQKLSKSECYTPSSEPFKT